MSKERQYICPKAKECSRYRCKRHNPHICNNVCQTECSLPGCLMGCEFGCIPYEPTEESGECDNKRYFCPKCNKYQMGYDPMRKVYKCFNLDCGYEQEHKPEPKQSVEECPKRAEGTETLRCPSCGRWGCWMTIFREKEWIKCKCGEEVHYHLYGTESGTGKETGKQEQGDVCSDKCSLCKSNEVEMLLLGVYNKLSYFGCKSKEIAEPLDRCRYYHKMGTKVLKDAEQKLRQSILSEKVKAVEELKRPISKINNRPANMESSANSWFNEAIDKVLEILKR